MQVTGLISEYSVKQINPELCKVSFTILDSDKETQPNYHYVYFWSDQPVKPDSEKSLVGYTVRVKCVKPDPFIVKNKLLRLDWKVSKNIDVLGKIEKE